MNSVKPNEDQLRFAKLTVSVRIDKTHAHMFMGKFRQILAFLLLAAPMVTPAQASQMDYLLDDCKRHLTSLDKYVFGEFPELKISEEFVKNQKNINQARLNETLFILPSNDGEAVRAVQLMKALKAPHLYLTNSRWGAKLRDIHELPQVLWSHAGIKRVAILEIPGPDEEENMRKLGLEVMVLDHHHYGEKLDRTTAKSSLEQLMDFVGWEPSRYDSLIAVNDRSYIPGLVNFGATPDEIRFIRTYDLVAQRRSRAEVRVEIEHVQRKVIPKVPSEGGVYVITERMGDETILKQELALLQKDGKANILFLQPDRIGFSGSPAAAKKLQAIDFTQFGYLKTTRSGEPAFKTWGGGDPDGSIFFNFVPNYPPMYARGKKETSDSTESESSFASDLRELIGNSADRLLGDRGGRGDLIPPRVLDEVKKIVLDAVLEEQRKQPQP